ncbi:phage tail tape measure protein, lambda family [Luteibacter sp. UNCMF331Sha3.1]|uniref:phage tail tape measure protein n=1 Tax=Luteibacter sp. UNCMF331Sha3.1 TaxID=1502760 RepID=UPI0008AF514D|nr:phage tail tape measure protein [Luteibacter sp. UNCMF331Sha3.1]SEN09882.1 phage tail tape measure protein, lambda family [Luteibacter sp. UNCMF331Sha3.1]
MDIASLGVRVTTQGATEGAAQLDKLDAAAKRAEKSAGALGASTDRTADALGGYAAKASVAAKSSKEIANATRMIGPQLTDIVTGLAAGQAPLTVLIQQGGQLKDQFGGIAPALKATAGYIVGLVNPATIAGAAIATLGAAWVQGAEENEALSRSIIATGNYAGVTTEYLQDMARGLSQVAGTQRAAAAALAEITQSGKFTANQIAEVGIASVALARTSGQAVDETVQQFAKLADAPTKAITELDSKYHFLTASIYSQISALEDQGRTQDAATLAIRTYSQVAVERANAVEGSLSNLERGWIKVKDGALGAWDAMIGGAGRQTTIAQQIQALGEKINNLQSFSSPDLSDRSKQSAIANMRKQLADLTRQEQQELRAAYLDGGKKQLASAAIAFDQEASGFATIEQKRATEIAAAHTKANDLVAKAFAAGDIKLAAQIQANEQTIVAGIASKYKDPKPKREKADPDYYTQDRAQIEAEIAAEGKLFDQRTRAAAAIEVYESGLADLISARRADIDLQVQSYGLGSMEIARQAQLNQIYADAARKRIALVHDMNRSTDNDTREMYANELAALDSYTQQRIAVEVNGFREVDLARENWHNGARSAYADTLDDGRNVAGMTHDFFINSYESMGDALADFAVNGKASFKSLASSILKDLARMEIRIAASQALMAIFGGGAATGSGAMGGSMASIFDGGFSGFAKGGVFNSPSLSSYSGQIVSQPTMFAFAKGAGLMGEAGPEAIMPLSRGSNGKLGVAVNGGGTAGSNDGTVVNVSVTVNSDGASSVQTSGGDQAFAKQFGQAMANAASQEIAKALRPGGQIYSDRNRR